MPKRLGTSALNDLFWNPLHPLVCVKMPPIHVASPGSSIRMCDSSPVVSLHFGGTSIMFQSAFYETMFLPLDWDFLKGIISFYSSPQGDTLGIVENT